MTSAPNWLNDLIQDLQYTFRTLRREAGFTTFAVLIAGLGIGASSTVFSVVNALLVRPLPFHDPKSLMWIAGDAKDGNLSGVTLQVGHLIDLRDTNKSFAELAGYFAFYGVGDAKLTSNGEPERLSEVPVSQNFFPVLGVKPVLGRTFNDEESKWNAPKTVLLSHGFWKRRFASDPTIVGRSLTINDRPAAVIGVLPESFDFGSVFAPGSRIDLFSAFPLSPETNRWGNTLAVVGRLKPGVGPGGAQAELTPLAAEIERRHPERNTLRPRITPLEEKVSGRVKPALFVLGCAVAVVMLIVCANLSNLQLGRMAARQKEMAIRTALGAGRYRLIRQLLTESIVLSCSGAVLGLFLAWAGTRALTQLQGVSIPLLDSVRLDSEAVAFTLLTAVATGIIFGLMPALQVRVFGVYEALKDGTRGSSSGRRHAWIRNALVVSEIAFACVLLVGAGLLMRSFLQVLDVNLGFRPQHAAMVRIDPGRNYSTQPQRNAYFDEALRVVRELPGVEGAGLSDALPLGRNRSWGFGVKGRVFARGTYPSGFVRVISDGYFRSMGISLREGRDFAPTDDPAHKGVIIINETLAKSLWPNESAIGKLLQFRPEREIIGVVGDVRHIALEQASGPEFYIPIRQTNDYASVDLVVRSTHSTADLAPMVRAALKSLDPNLPSKEFRTLQQLVDKSVSPRRFVVLFLAGFAAFALMLASLGIYGVISYSVTRRTQEIGIRAALGASAASLQMKVLRETLVLAATGMAIGMIASWFLARALGTLLFGITPGDPATYVGMLLVLTAVSSLAGYLPARRAARIDPMIALRAD
ncbi:MAG: ABC transporter permease [Acidobacteria bacterium]|nr:ABC transporter permease [Acidobacteriota bacterium]